jgi:quercetin 2,3-dioxygenase
MQELTSRETMVGNLKIRRALPRRERRMIGAWCFLDRYGPLSFSEGRPMDVAEHPHIGLQTVSWLFEGEVLHLDSLGSEETVHAGGVNIMTSGSGIAHVELTPEKNSGKLNGVQLWVALPDAARDVAPSFQHVAEVPQLELPGGSVKIFSGELGGVVAPSQHFTEIVGAEIDCRSGETVVPLTAGWEHAILVVDGDAEIEHQRLEVNSLYYFAPGRSEVTIRSRGGARLILIGGAPFDEPIVMWWNFVARTHEEIAEAREDWEQRRRFEAVSKYRGPRIPAPDLRNRIAPANPAS